MIQRPKLRNVLLTSVAIATVLALHAQDVHAAEKEDAPSADYALAADPAAETDTPVAAETEATEDAADVPAAVETDDPIISFAAESTLEQQRENYEDAKAKLEEIPTEDTYERYEDANNVTVSGTVLARKSVSADGIAGRQNETLVDDGDETRGDIDSVFDGRLDTSWTVKEPAKEQGFVFRHIVSVDFKEPRDIKTIIVVPEKEQEKRGNISNRIVLFYTHPGSNHRDQTSPLTNVDDGLEADPLVFEFNPGRKKVLANIKHLDIFLYVDKEFKFKDENQDVFSVAEIDFSDKPFKEIEDEVNNRRSKTPRKKGTPEVVEAGKALLDAETKQLSERLKAVSDQDKAVSAVKEAYDGATALLDDENVKRWLNINVDSLSQSQGDIQRTFNAIDAAVTQVRNAGEQLRTTLIDYAEQRRAEAEKALKTAQGARKKHRKDRYGFDQPDDVKNWTITATSNTEENEKGTEGGVEKAFDGRLDTAWVSKEGDKLPQTITVKFDKPRNIQGIVYYPRTENVFGDHRQQAKLVDGFYTGKNEQGQTIQGPLPDLSLEYGRDFTDAGIDKDQPFTPRVLSTGKLKDVTEISLTFRETINGDDRVAAAEIGFIDEDPNKVYEPLYKKERDAHNNSLAFDMEDLKLNTEVAKKYQAFLKAAVDELQVSSNGTPSKYSEYQAVKNAVSDRQAVLDDEDGLIALLTGINFDNGKLPDPDTLNTFITDYFEPKRQEAADAADGIHEAEQAVADYKAQLKRANDLFNGDAEGRDDLPEYGELQKALSEDGKKLSIDDLKAATNTLSNATDALMQAEIQDGLDKIEKNADEQRKAFEKIAAEIETSKKLNEKIDDAVFTKKLDNARDEHEQVEKDNAAVDHDLEDKGIVSAIEQYNQAKTQSAENEAKIAKADEIADFYKKIKDAAKEHEEIGQDNAFQDKLDEAAKESEGIRRDNDFLDKLDEAAKESEEIKRDNAAIERELDREIEDKGISDALEQYKELSKQAAANEAKIAKADEIAAKAEADKADAKAFEKALAEAAKESEAIKRDNAVLDRDLEDKGINDVVEQYKKLSEQAEAAEDLVDTLEKEQAEQAEQADHALENKGIDDVLEQYEALKEQAEAAEDLVDTLDKEAKDKADADAFEKALVDAAEEHEQIVKDNAFQDKLDEAAKESENIKRDNAALALAEHDELVDNIKHAIQSAADYNRELADNAAFENTLKEIEVERGLEELEAGSDQQNKDFDTLEKLGYLENELPSDEVLSEAAEHNAGEHDLHHALDNLAAGSEKQNKALNDLEAKEGLENLAESHKQQFAELDFLDKLDEAEAEHQQIERENFAKDLADAQAEHEQIEAENFDKALDEARKEHEQIVKDNAVLAQSEHDKLMDNIKHAVQSATDYNKELTDKAAFDKAIDEARIESEQIREQNQANDELNTILDQEAFDRKKAEADARSDKDAEVAKDYFERRANEAFEQKKAEADARSDQDAEIAKQYFERKKEEAFEQALVDAAEEHAQIEKDNAKLEAETPKQTFETENHAAHAAHQGYDVEKALNRIKQLKVKYENQIKGRIKALIGRGKALGVNTGALEDAKNEFEAALAAFDPYIK